MNEAYKDELFRTLELIRGTETHYFHNKLMEEAGEIAAVFSAYMGSSKKVKKFERKHGSLREALLDELGDTVNVIMILSARYSIKPEEVIERGRVKMKIKNDERE